MVKHTLVYNSKNNWQYIYFYIHMYIQTGIEGKLWPADKIMCVRPSHTHTHADSKIQAHTHKYTQCLDSAVIATLYNLSLFLYPCVSLSHSVCLTHTISLSLFCSVCVFRWCRQNRQNVTTTTGYGLSNGNANGFSLLNLDSSLAVNKKSQVTSAPHMIVDS